MMTVSLGAVFGYYLSQPASVRIGDGMGQAALVRYRPESGVFVGGRQSFRPL